MDAVEKIFTPTTDRTESRDSSVGITIRLRAGRSGF
jgi:hypothetical protein